MQKMEELEKSGDSAVAHMFLGESVHSRRSSRRVQGDDSLHVISPGLANVVTKPERDCGGCKPLGT